MNTSPDSSLITTGVFEKASALLVGDVNPENRAGKQNVNIKIIISYNRNS